MEYFILSQKQNIPNTIKLNLKTDNGYERRQMIEKQYADDVNDVSIVYTKDKKMSFYADVIDTPTFLISEKVKEVFVNYDDSIIVKCVILSGENSDTKKVYWMPLMDCIDCMSPETEFYKDGSLKKLVLDKAKIEGKKIFRVANLKEYPVIINLDMAESLLRRFLSGIEMTKVKVNEIVKREKV